MHFATAVKFIVGLRVAVVSNSAIVVSTTTALATRTLPYLVGSFLGSLFSPFPMFVLIASILNVDLCSQQCQEYNQALSAYDQAWQNYYIQCDRYRESYYAPGGEHDQCIARNYYGWLICQPFCPVEAPSLEFPHIPDQCDCQDQNRKYWIQIVYGQEITTEIPNNHIASPSGCWAVLFSYDPDNNLFIEYNPGLNQDYLRFKALKPNQVKNSDIDTEVEEDTFQAFDKAFWAAQYVDMECRKWQPGDLIPTK